MLHVLLEMIFFILHITVFSKAVLKVIHISLIDRWDVCSSLGDPRRLFCAPSLMDWLLWSDLFSRALCHYFSACSCFFYFYPTQLCSILIVVVAVLLVSMNATDSEKHSMSPLTITTCYHCKL